MTQPQAVVLTITAHADGRIIVSGPIENKLLCYGLLEIARQQVERHQAEASRIIQPIVTLKP